MATSRSSFVSRAVDFAHPARADGGEDLERAEPRAGSDHRRETSTHPGLGKAETELSWKTGVIIAAETLGGSDYPAGAKRSSHRSRNPESFTSIAPAIHPKVSS